MLGAVIVVLPNALVIFPSRMTGVPDVMLTPAWAGPEKLMPMGLSALIDKVRVSSAAVAYSKVHGSSVTPSTISGGFVVAKPKCPSV